MTDKTTNRSPDWTEFQRKYWEAWTELGRQAFGAVPPPSASANPWTEALEQWWKAAGVSAPPEIEDFYAKLIEQGKAFFRVSEGLSRVFESATSSGQSMLDWQAQMQQALSGMKAAFSGSETEAHDLLRQVMAFWELPLDTWQRTASSMSVLPGDILQNLKPESLEQLTRTFDDRIDRFLS
ncbi:MAG: poly(R)-hydroxyalkanoic acid synthase subunit PhaE, partial [Acidiferrobacterales bacterium]